MGDSVKFYGFAYTYEGRRSTFRVLAHSEAEATKRAEAMRAHRFVGELAEISRESSAPDALQTAAAASDN